jgi:uncharacterized membrane protein (DUF373 family)
VVEVCRTKLKKLFSMKLNAFPAVPNTQFLSSLTLHSLLLLFFYGIIKLKICEKYTILTSPHQEVEVITMVTFLIIIVNIFATVHHCYDASYNYCCRLLDFGSGTS